MILYIYRRENKNEKCAWYLVEYHFDKNKKANNYSSDKSS